MWNDIVDLRDFYASPLGRAAQRMIRRRLRELWPDVSGLRVLGIGYAVPYLGIFRPEAERTLVAMPAGQGVHHWPQHDAGLTTLTHEAELPFPDLSMDRILLVHSLECGESVRPMLREIWRVLSDSGRLVVVVPNRRGFWARTERTPFGVGRPYSRSQLSRLLRESMFMPMQNERALFVPPVPLRVLVHSALMWEKIGQRFFPGFAGVNMTEAVKQIYAGTATIGEPARKRVLSTVPSGNSMGRERER